MSLFVQWIVFLNYFTRLREELRKDGSQLRDAIRSDLRNVIHDNHILQPIGLTGLRVQQVTQQLCNAGRRLSGHV